MDLSPDALYMELTGLTKDEMAEKWGIKPPSRIRQWRRRRWANAGPLAKRFYRVKDRIHTLGWGRGERSGVITPPEQQRGPQPR